MSIQRTPSGRWRARWRTPDGVHRSETFTLKRDAERFLNREKVELEQGKAGFTNARGVLSDLIPEWWAATEKRVKPRTAERYQYATKIIEKRIGDVKLSDLTYQRVQAFVNDLGVDYQPRSVSAIYGVLSLILTSGVNRNQLRPIKAPDLPKVYEPKLTIPTKYEVEALATAATLRIKAAIILSGYCGLREGELLGLHRRDVNLDAGWVFVHQARNKTTGALESTKTDKARRVYLPGRVKDELERHIAEFPSEELFPITGRRFQKEWESARAQVGVPTVRFHDLRHAAASMMIEAGWSVTQVSKQLGHAQATMTLNTYAHLWPDSYGDAIKKMDAYLAHEAAT
jgi:integrase